MNPVNQEQISIWVADYVLGSYGSGAIMAVPAHDSRDFEFAQVFDLPIRQVVTGRQKEEELPFAGLIIAFCVFSSCLELYTCLAVKHISTKIKAVWTEMWLPDGEFLQ